jgi:uncharacterized protein YbjT (DUF2867 family)
MDIGKKREILVTGATGRQGGAVARRLLKDGWYVIALTRDPAKPSSKELARLGIEVVKGDLNDRASLNSAMKKTYGVFAVLTPFEQGLDAEVQQGKNIADAAKAAGIKHLVYSSVAAAERHTGIPHFETKRKVEQYIGSLGIPATILRPVFFTYNFNSPDLRQSILGGTLSLAINPDKMLQMLAAEDFAEFVTIAFANPQTYIGKSMELAGDELTMTETAEVFSRVIGRHVRFVEMPIEQVRKASEDMAKMFEWFNREDFRANIMALRSTNPGLMTLETWLRRTGWVNAAAGKARAA